MPAWNLCHLADDMSPDYSSHGFRAIHACTDHTFWGRRDVMKVASYELWPAIYEYFNTQRPDALGREMFVGALLGSLNSIPVAVRGMSVFEGLKHYNKVTTLPFPDITGDRGLRGVKKTRKRPSMSSAFSKMLTNTREAWDAGVEFFDPLSNSNSGPIKRLLPGLDGNHEHDYHRSGVFRTEKDFLTWLIRSNITVCDLGAGTTSVLYKGRKVVRESAPCLVLRH